MMVRVIYAPGLLLVVIIISNIYYHFFFFFFEFNSPNRYYYCFGFIQVEDLPSIPV